jgi:hypothetical protein
VRILCFACGLIYILTGVLGFRCARDWLDAHGGRRFTDSMSTVGCGMEEGVQHTFCCKPPKQEVHTDRSTQTWAPGIGYKGGSAVKKCASREQRPGSSGPGAAL